MAEEENKLEGGSLGGRCERGRKVRGGEKTVEGGLKFEMWWSWQGLRRALKRKLPFASIRS